MKFKHLKLWSRIFFALLISIASAFSHGTIEPVALQSTPQLLKAVNQAQLVAQTIEYSNQLPIDGVAVQLSSDSIQKYIG